MALPSSGALSISAIKTELDSSSNSLRTLSGLAGFSTPDAISEFYGYSALTAITLSNDFFDDTEQGCSEGPDSETSSFYSSTDPVAVNSYIYDNNRDKLNGNDKWFYYPGGTKLIQIREDGKVNDIYSCE